jgi:hypothetical protein
MNATADVAIVFGSAAPAPGKKPESVRATCEAIGLPRSTYYYQSHRSASAIALEQKIVLRLHELRECKPNDGYRRMTLQLQAEGFQVNRKRIARLMRIHSLTKRPGPEAPSANSPQTARLTGPFQVWVTEIAYAHIHSGLVYTAAVIDAWSREIVGYSASLQITNRLVSIALHSAVRANRPAPGCIHHSKSSPSGKTPSRQIVDVKGYESWKDVTDHPREFIQTVYSREIVDGILLGALTSTAGRNLQHPDNHRQEG